MLWVPGKEDAGCSPPCWRVVANLSDAPVNTTPVFPHVLQRHCVSGKDHPKACSFDCFQRKQGKHAKCKYNVVYDGFARYFPSVSRLHTPSVPQATSRIWSPTPVTAETRTEV